MEKRFTVIAGPCVIESEDIVMQIAKALKEIADRFLFQGYWREWRKVVRLY